jgi:hypothetical protein
MARSRITRPLLVTTRHATWVFPCYLHSAQAAMRVRPVLGLGLSRRGTATRAPRAASARRSEGGGTGRVRFVPRRLVLLRARSRCQLQRRWRCRRGSTLSYPAAGRASALALPVEMQQGVAHAVLATMRTDPGAAAVLTRIGSAGRSGLASEAGTAAGVRAARGRMLASRRPSWAVRLAGLMSSSCRLAHP